MATSSPHSTASSDEETPDEVFSRLFSVEVAWRDRQLFLESRGYMLRPRLRPDWVPSWRTMNGSIIDAEDILLFRSASIWWTRLALTMASLCTSNASRLAIKSQPSFSSQTRRMRELILETTPCLYILEHFQDDVDPTISYVGMPFLRPLHRPPHDRVNDCVDLATHYLEGLVFQHEMGVTHRYVLRSLHLCLLSLADRYPGDCSLKNLLVDASALFPDGHHPIKLEFTPDYRKVVRPLPRSKDDVRDYYVDFGISSHIPSGSPSVLVTGISGRNQNVSGLSETVPYDPFKVDIFSMGQVFEEVFTKTYSSVEFLNPLIVQLMTALDPAARPTAVQALAKWNAMSPPETQENVITVLP
ncbi:hypothetical protein PENSPDRAFT_753942 [Peniophora sp. CONT]|nr:hypothetical protein PENSPDRAFT_753942 [Peniophora sp. CONT]